MRPGSGKWEDSGRFVRCFEPLTKSRATLPLFLPPPLPLTQEELATLADGERKRGEKDELAEAAPRWPAELFGQNPVKLRKKQTGQTVARLCIVLGRALFGRAI